MTRDLILGPAPQSRITLLLICEALGAVDDEYGVCLVWHLRLLYRLSERAREAVVEDVGIRLAIGVRLHGDRASHDMCGLSPQYPA